MRRFLAFLPALVLLAILAAVTGSGVERDSNTDIAANDWPGITDVPDPLTVFDPTLGGAGPTGFRPLLPRDQIEPVYQPRFTRASGVTWNPEDLVIGVNLEGEARAYPIGFLTQREMVVDNHRGIPTLVTCCLLYTSDAADE